MFGKLLCENIQLVEDARPYSTKHRKSNKECNKKSYTQHRPYVRIEQYRSPYCLFLISIPMPAIHFFVYLVALSFYYSLKKILLGCFSESMLVLRGKLNCRAEKLFIRPFGDFYFEFSEI